jgi:hypothetical protein
VADENDVAEILVCHNADDVSHVSLETDLRARQMAPLAKAGQRGGGHAVTLPTQERHEFLPAPGPVPCRVHEKERLQTHGHGRDNAATGRLLS